MPDEGKQRRQLSEDRNKNLVEIDTKGRVCHDTALSALNSREDLVCESDLTGFRDLCTVT